MESTTTGPAKMSPQPEVANGDRNGHLPGGSLGQETWGPPASPGTPATDEKVALTTEVGATKNSTTADNVTGCEAENGNGRPRKRKAKLRMPQDDMLVHGFLGSGK